MIALHLSGYLRVIDFNLLQMKLFLKYGLFFYFRLQGTQRLLNQVKTQIPFLIFGQFGIAHRVGYRHGRHDAISPHGQGDGHYRSYMHHRQPCPVYLFCQRCTATCIGSSGGGKNHPIDISRLQLLRNRLAKLLRFSNRSGITYGDIV